jgi:hypothetical protein
MFVTVTVVVVVLQLGWIDIEIDVDGDIGTKVFHHMRQSTAVPDFDLV